MENENGTSDINNLKSRLGNINVSREEEEDEPINPHKDDTPYDEEEELADVEDEQKNKIIPIYLGSEEPPGETNWAKWALLHGYTEEDLKDMGKNPGTIRICAQELERDGYRKRPSKKQTTAMAKTQQSSVKVFSKAGPPEALLEGISIPMEGREAQIFENGLKSGMSLLILGVRVAQELSTVGVQQAKPIMEMAKSMREGEAIAAKTSASEAAQEAAIGISKIFGPAIESLQDTVGRLEDKTSSGSHDPLKDMVARTMEPLFKNMMNMMMPGMGGMSGMGGMGGNAPQQQSGWKIENE